MEQIEKLAFYPEFDTVRKVGFHAIMGDYVLEMVEYFKAFNPQTQYPLLVKEIEELYLSKSDMEILEKKTQEAMPVLLEFINDFPKSIGERDAEDLGYKEFPRWLQLALLYTESKTVVPSVRYWETVLDGLEYDESRGCYTSKYLRELSGVIDCRIDDLFRKELDDFCNWFVAPIHKPKTIKEADIKGGNPDSDRTITTVLNFRTSERVPTKPNEYYSKKFSKFFEILNEVEITPDDIVALNWCVKDWLGQAKKYLSAKTRSTRYLAINILEALIHEYESGFWEPKMRHVLATNPEFARELRKDLKEVAELFIENIDLYYKKDYSSLKRRFIYLENVTDFGIIIDLIPVVDAIEELTNKK